MPRILVCECKQEVSSFNPVSGRYGDFDVSFGPDLVAAHAGVGSEMAGALGVFAARADVDVVPGYGARAVTSSGTLDDADFGRIAREFLDAVRGAGEVDAVYFALHGSLASRTEHDAEGYLLEETRRIVGERVPILVSLDLHGVLTDRMLAQCDALTLYHTYPHVDFFETGARAARLLLGVLDGAMRPVSVRVRIPALVRGDELVTETGLFGRCVRRAVAVEEGPGGLSGGIFIGNPFTDVPELASNVYLCVDGDPAAAERAAIEIASDFWGIRERLQQPLTSLDEGVRRAAAARGRVVLVDAADATSSGAPGDSNAVLRALVESGYRRTVLVPIVDAPAVEAAFAVGVGAEIRAPVGGTLDRRFAPLPMRLRVRMLSDGRFVNESHGSWWDAGPSAVLESDNVTLVATSRPVSLYDRSLFLAHGQDPARFDATVVKSPHCQRRFFVEGAALVLNVDAPGATSANLRSLGHARCRRPIFPLDEDVAFSPVAERFGRAR